MAKRTLPCVLGLIALDQAIKLAISHFALNAQVILISGVLVFHPVQNVNLNWLASMAGILTPVWMMVAFQILMLLVVTGVYRYFAYLAGKREPWLTAFYIFMTAGIGCSFADVLFWGGSLDFLRLFSWFTFDTKDVFLNVSFLSLILWEIHRSKGKGHEPNGEHLESVGFWIKQGCPMQRPNEQK